MKNRRIMRNWLLNLLVISLSASIVLGQGPTGEYPGAGVGFDSGCGYPNAGATNPGTTNPGLLTPCGTTTDVNTGPLFETATGFDLTLELVGIEANDSSGYGVRVFYGPQNMCCTICLDALVVLGQQTTCGTIPTVPDLTSFLSPATNMPFPAAVINFGELAFGNDLISYSDLCPNTEYFVNYQVVVANDFGPFEDEDDNDCALNDATISAFGPTMSQGTIVSPGTRDPLLIDAAVFALQAGDNCQSANVVLELTADVLAGCTALGQDRLCSQGLELELRNPSSTCLDGLATGPIINDPTACFVGIGGLPFVTTFNLGNGQSVCDIIDACAGTGTIELYATYTFCESDDIAGDGSGNDEAVFVIDVLSALSAFNCTNCAACAITPDPATNIICNDNGTPFDTTDDMFTFDILVNGSNTDAAASNTFNDDQGNNGIAYGTTVSYGPFPISGGAITVNFTDVDDGMCTASITATPPATCSDAVCTITPDPATNIVCDDNGTPFDPSDDMFTFDILVNGSNTDPAASNTFNDDQGNNGIAYAMTVSYGPFPISGGNVMVTFTDADAPASAACTATMMGAAPATCSDATCVITPDVATNIVCDDNGTPADPTDDMFTFDILVNGSNTDPAAGNTFNDDQNNNGIAYGMTVSYGPFPISGGPIVVTFTDADAPTAVGCTATMMANPPATCSGSECTITPDAATNIVCNDAGTPDDPSDDTYTFDILVNGNSTFPGATNTFNDSEGGTGIAYGTTVSYGPYLISGGNITVTFTDANEASCTGMMMATAPATCSGSVCTITPDMAANIVCDDNGTPADASDDTFTFDILVNGNSTFSGATNTFNDDQGNTGIAYGTTVSYGSYPISGGNITVMFTDADEASCTGMMMATAPATCSGSVCTITPDMATNIVCDNAGTPNDASDDTFTFDILVNGNSTFPGATNTFNDDQGNTGIAYGTTVSYGSYPISGGNVTVMFTDADEASCTSMMMATAPATCSGSVCTITPNMATNIVCDDAGTPDDPSDDTFTFDILVNGNSTFPGATNTFNDDQGNTGIAYGTTVSYGTYPISGGNITVMFTDADEASCTNMMMATAPATCSTGPCEDAISGSVMAEEVGCSAAGIEVTIFDATGAVVDVVMTDANGVYTLPGVFPCGSYSAELTANVPACYTDSGGVSGPIGFIVNGDGVPNGVNFTENAEVPTLSQWGLMSLALLLMIFGALKLGTATVASFNGRKN